MATKKDRERDKDEKGRKEGIEGLKGIKSMFKEEREERMALMKWLRERKMKRQAGGRRGPCEVRTAALGSSHTCVTSEQGN